MSFALDDCLNLAKPIMWDAVDQLLVFYGQQQTNLNASKPAEGPVTQADLAIDRQILAALKAVFPSPEFGYLSEENDKFRLHSPQPQPLPHPWIWVLDPIDGTRDFLEHTGQFTIHLALLHHHVPVLALLAVPVEGKLYFAIQGQGTFVDDRNVSQTQSIRVSSRYQLNDLKVVVGRNRNHPRFAEFLEDFPVKQQVWGGSLGYKVVQILEQQGDVYLSLSSQSAPKDWDLAAPDLLLKEAGGKFTRENGSDLVYNQGDLNQWGCLIGSNNTCHGQLCQSATRILESWFSF